MITIHYRKSTSQLESEELRSAIEIAFNTTPEESLISQKDLMDEVAKSLGWRNRWLRQYNRFSFWREGFHPRIDECEEHWLKFSGGRWKFLKKKID